MKTRTLTALALAVALIAPSAMAQNKAAYAKSSADFYKLSAALSASLADLTKRATTASPNDKDMLKLVVNQLSVASASADGVLALGAVAAEMRDAGDLGIVKKHLGSQCVAMKSVTEPTAKYFDSLSANIAAVATAAEVTKARDLLRQMGQHALCGGGKA